MAKTKSGSSAAQRREQARRQQQGNKNNATARQKARRQSALQKKATNSNWLWVGGTLVLVAVIVGVFIYLSRQPAPTTSNGNSSNTKAVLQNLTTINPSTLTTVGTGGVQNPMVALSNATPLVGPNGKPEFFYAGGEYCPYCAAQRWGMIVALSRFGTFSNISEITSSEDNLPTFTFVGSHYTSQYVDFVPVEMYDNQQPPQPLQTPTSAQQKLIQTYDYPPYLSSQGGIPFIDIANKFISSGSYYSPTDLSGLTWNDIAGDVQNPDTKIAKDILGTANYLTAAICVATNNQPASVCTTTPVTQIEPTLPKASYNGGNGQLALATYSADMIDPKRGL